MYFDLRARALSWVEISKQKNLIRIVRYQT